MTSKIDHGEIIFYGLNFAAIIISAPIWVPFYLLGLLAKKLGIKP